MKKRKYLIILSIAMIITYTASVLLFFYTGVLGIVGSLVISAFISLIVFWRPFTKKGS